MDRGAKGDFLLNLLFVAGVLGSLYLAGRLLTGWFLPFLLGFAIAFMLKPLTGWMCQYMQMRRRPAAIFAALLFYLLLGVGLWILTVTLAGQLGILLERLPQLYGENLLPLLTKLNGTLVAFFSGLSQEMGTSVEALLSTLSAWLLEAVSGLSVPVVGWLTGFLQKIPLYALTLVFTIISSIFICADYRQVVGFLLAQVPKNLRPKVMELKNFGVQCLGKMLKAYTLILLITFLELSLGLWLLGVEPFALIALIIAFLDILPLIGSGGVLIPWGLLLVLQGNLPMGIGIFLLYAIITVVRNIIEPKIVGGQIGLHPLVTITAMFFGIKALGVAGILLGPMGVLLLKHLNDTGTLHLYETP